MIPVSHGPAVVASDEAVWPGVARQDVGDAELGHVAVVGAAAWRKCSCERLRQTRNSIDRWIHATLQNSWFGVWLVRAAKFDLISHKM